MATWRARHLQQRASRAYLRLSSPRIRHRDVLERFAGIHGLSYFSPDLPSRTLEAIDDKRTRSTHGLCIGVHAGYMTSTFSFVAIAQHPNFVMTEKAWLETHVELSAARGLPFIYVGTRQQTKTQYAEVLTRHPQARYLHIACPPALDRKFHERYAVLAAIEDVEYVKQLFTDDVIAALVGRRETIAFHIEDATIIAMTERQKPRIKAVDALFHSALWMAGVLDITFGGKVAK